jgi:hypothetical protein
MTTKTEGPHTGGFLVSESPGTISRDAVTVTVPADTTYKPGTVMATLAADGNNVPYDPAGSDGSETATGVLYGEAANADTEDPAEVSGVVINFSAEVRSADLIWADGLSADDKASALADLAAAGVKAR